MHSIFKTPKTNVCILINLLKYLYQNGVSLFKQVSEKSMEKELSQFFMYTVQSSKKVGVNIFHSFLTVFPFLSMQQISSFIL